MDFIMNIFNKKYLSCLFFTIVTVESSQSKLMAAGLVKKWGQYMEEMGDSVLEEKQVNEYLNKQIQNQKM